MNIVKVNIIELPKHVYNKNRGNDCMNVAIYHVSFPYEGITLRPTLHVLPGHDTTKTLRVYMSGLSEEIA